MDDGKDNKDKAKPIETTPLVVSPSPPQTIDIRDASVAGLALMEERVRVQMKMIKLVISLTSPSQWVVFASADGKSETVYPTGGAADTILRRGFGLGYTRKIVVDDTGDGKLATCTLGLKGGDGEVFEEFIGYRYLKGFVKNEADLRSGSEENAKSKAVRDLLGLRFRTPAELKEMGLDVSKMERRVEFQDHSDAGAPPGTFIVPFGKGIKGKPISDISDKDLDYLAGALKKSMADPEKKRWAKRNEQQLEACRDEYKRRHPPAEKPAENGKPKESAPAAEPKVDPSTGEVSGGEHDYGPPALTDEEVEAMEAEARGPGSKG